MRYLLCVALLLAFAAPASAQSATGIPLNQEKDVTPEQRAKLDKFREEHQRERPGPPNGQRPQGPPQ